MRSRVGALREGVGHSGTCPEELEEAFVLWLFQKTKKMSRNDDESTKHISVLSADCLGVTSKMRDILI